MNELEKNFWQRWKRQLDKVSKKDLHYERIENRMGTGIPDVMLCYKGLYAFVELKVHPNKRQANQRVWHRRHERVGGNVFTVTYKVRTGSCRIEVGYERSLPTDVPINGLLEIILGEISNGNI